MIGAADELVMRDDRIDIQLAADMEGFAQRIVEASASSRRCIVTMPCAALSGRPTSITSCVLAARAGG